MFYSRRFVRLDLNSFSSLGNLRQFIRKKFEGNAPAKAKIFRLIHDAHSASADLLRDAVMRDGLADHATPTRGRNVRPRCYGKSILNSSWVTSSSLCK